MSFVLDNSVSMRWFFGDGSPGQLAYADGVLVALKHDRAIVPMIWSLEVANVLVRAEAKALVTKAQSDAFLMMLDSVSIAHDETAFAHSRAYMLQLARRHRLSTYDASYLELALRLNLPIATLDEDLSKAAANEGVRRFA